jgi:hypothetical protein
MRSLRAWLIFFILSGSGLVSLPLFSQNGDDPRLDQVPASLWNKILAPGNTTTSSSVITVNNWDNVNLGVDFGESFMTANPAIPSRHFTAYNTNNAHHTENGLDWESVIPDFGSTLVGDPVVAYDSLGNLFYANMFGTSGVLGLKVVKSTDNGITWGPGITALSGNDKCWMACDQTGGPFANYVYTCMTNNVIGSFSRSTDHGSTFSTTFTPANQTVPGMMVCVGPDNNIQGGSVYVVTNSGTAFASDNTFYCSHDGGLTFTLKSVRQFSNYVGTEVNGRNSVSGMRIAADNSYGPHRGRLYLVYASNDPPGDGNMPDIFCHWSDNGGTTWSAAKKINDDAGTQNNNQWHPAIWCDKDNGRLFVQWMDTRDTPTHDSAFIYASYSADGGATFVTNQKISNQKMKISCPTCGGGGTPAYQGDYNGVSSNKKVAMLGWTDFRNGSFMSTTAYFPDFSMAVDHSLDTLFTALDSTLISISVPEVKLYTDTVLLSAAIFPVPGTGTIAVSFPSGNRITSFPGTLPAKVKLTGNVPPGNYQARFYAKGPNGTPVHQRNTTLRVLSKDSVYVSVTAKPNPICAGTSSQLEAIAISGTSPYSYSWTPVSGLDNPGISNPLATPANSTVYHVTVTDAAFHTATDSILVSITPLPGSPGLISGPSVVCGDSTASFAIQSVPGATSYSWTVPAGAQILSGQNTTAVSVRWGNSDGNVSVIAGNQCGNSNPSVRAVTAGAPPGQPVTILGPALVCNSASVVFSVDTIPGATSYLWTVPADAFITGGQTTDSITVIWGSNPGDIMVTASNNCGESVPGIRSVGLETMPGPAGPVTGSDTVCSNHENYPYSVPEVAGATSYTWTIPTGTEILSGSGTHSIVIIVTPTAVSGPVTVRGNNTCGSGTAGSKEIAVKICAGIPEQNAESGIAVYPNPADKVLNIAVTGGDKKIDLAITDVRGMTVFRQSLDNGSAESIYTVDISTLPGGVYFIQLTFSHKLVVRKIVVQ